MLSSSIPGLESRIRRLETELASRERWRGTYVAGLTYLPNDVVVYNGQMYLALAQNFNQTPSTNPQSWYLFAFVNPMMMAGDLILGGTSGVPGRLAVGADNRVLTVDPTTHLPVWAALPPLPPDVGFANPMTTAGDIILGGTSGAPGRLAKGSDGRVLTVDPTTHLPVWASLPADVGFANPMTTAGDLILGGASGAPGRLGIGVDNRVLTIDPTTHLPVWANLPAGFPERSVLAVTTGTNALTAVATIVNMTSLTLDTDSMYDSGNGRIKATHAGKYRISVNVLYAGAAGGTLRWSRIRHNNTTTICDVTDTEPAGGFGTSAVMHCLTTIYTLAAGDYITPLAYQDSGGTLLITGHSCMEYIGA